MTGFEQLADGLEAMNAIARQRAVVDLDRDSLGTHVIRRGLLWIIPLARVTGEDATARDRFQRACADLEMAGIHFFGGDYFHGETLIDPDDGYGKQLATAGIHPDGRTPAWRVGDHAVVYVRASNGDESTLSLHILPAEWVWPRRGDAKRDQSRRRTMAKQLAAADPRWTWPDHRGRDECWCDRYKADDRFEPPKEQDLGHIRIVSTTEPGWSMTYEVECLICGRLFTVDQRDGHVVTWKWKPHGQKRSRA